MEYNRMKNWIVRIYEAAYPGRSPPNVNVMLREIFDYVVHGRNERQRAERLRAYLVRLYETFWSERKCIPFEPSKRDVDQMVTSIEVLRDFSRSRQKHSDELSKKLAVQDTRVGELDLRLRGAKELILKLRPFAVSHNVSGSHSVRVCEICDLLRKTAAFLSDADAVSNTHIFEHKTKETASRSIDAAKGTFIHDELTRLRAENERLKTLNHRLYESNDRLMRCNEDLKTENSRLISNQSPPVIKIEGVPDFVTQNTARANDRLSKRLTELKRELFQACNDRDRFESERNTARKAYALQEEMNKVRANQSPPAVEADNACLRVENERLSRQISSISAELGNSKQAYAFLQEEMNKVRAVFRKADFVTEEMAPSECAESLRKERETLRGKLADFETANNLLKSVKERKANRIAYLKAQICRLRNDLNDLAELPE